MPWLDASVYAKHTTTAVAASCGQETLTQTRKKTIRFDPHRRRINRHP